MGSYATLLATLDAWFARGREAAGAGVVPCRRSCSACCHGVFDISPADAELLAAGLAALEPGLAADVEARAAVAARATAQLALYAERLPTWGPPWDVDALDEQAFDGLCEQLAHAPCPALAEDGGCVVYAHRPATCRMTGLAMDAGTAGRLDNQCPIQDDHPRYAALAPTPFALMDFEDHAARADQAAVARGHRSTTVAAAIAAGASPEPPRSEQGAPR